MVAIRAGAREVPVLKAGRRPLWVNTRVRYTQMFSDTELSVLKSVMSFFDRPICRLCSRRRAVSAH
jgi:hypothetical protein